MDADGSVGYYTKIKLCLIPVCMTHKETIQWLASIFDEKVLVREIKNHKTMYRTTINRRSKLKVLIKKILPYMITKRERALTLLREIE